MREAIGDATPVGRPGRGRRPAARESILDAIRASEPLSRVELAAITGLTEAAVSMTVRRLLDEGLVVETGRAPTGGKPRTLLRLDPADAQVALQQAEANLAQTVRQVRTLLSNGAVNVEPRPQGTHSSTRCARVLFGRIGGVT